MDNIEFNTFFNALQGEFIDEFETAQENSCAVFIPLADTLTNLIINKEFALCHLAKPSPFFQDEYMVNDGREAKVLRIQNKHVQRCQNFRESTPVKIVGEEAGYSKKGRSYRIYVIEKPLQVYGTTVFNETCMESSISESWLNGSDCPSLQQCKSFINSFDEGKILVELNASLNNILKNYVFLGDYLTETAEKLRGIIDFVMNKIFQKETTLGPKLISLLPICLECYVLNYVYDVLFPIICRRFDAQDKALSEKLMELNELNVTPVQFGALEAFSCPIPASVVELARLPSLCSPRQQLQCIKNTIDLISAEIKQHLLESRGFLSFTAGLPCVTADDLIPILATTVIKSKLNHLSAYNFFMETFSWGVCSKDIYGYSSTTFKAVIEFLKSVQISQLTSKSDPKIKKELSLEELMEVTRKLDDQHRSQQSEINTTSVEIDRQMEKITKMIKASTRELTQVQHQGFSTF